MDESTDLQMFAVKLPPPLIRKLRIKAASESVTLQELVARLLTVGLLDDARVTDGNEARP